MKQKKTNFYRNFELESNEKQMNERTEKSKANKLINYKKRAERERMNSI